MPIAGIAMALSVLAPALQHGDRNALRRAMQQCVARQKATGKPAPCEYVSTAKGFVVFREPRAEHLFVPIAILSGIEDRKIVAPGTLPYWSLAWQEAVYYEKHPRWNVALAINSKRSRSQDQLHIHIACLQKNVGIALYRDRNRIGSTWSVLKLQPQSYSVMRETSLTGSGDPFRLVYRRVGGRADSMALETIVVVGAQWRQNGRTVDGFYVLNDYAHGHDTARGESLLDKACSSR